jgi:chromosome partitioning protein
LVNQKGGCGKTTVAIHLGAALASQGERVLLVDLDPQAHATLGLGQYAERGTTVLDVLADGVPVERGLRIVRPGLQLLPANLRLAEFEEVAARMIRPEAVLRRALTECAAQFDYAILDCPPRADGVLTSSALCASTLALLVVEAGVFALQGALKTIGVLRETAGNQGSSFDWKLVCTLFERDQRVSREILIALQQRFGPELFDTAISAGEELREAALRGLPVQELAPESRCAREFRSLALELRGLRLRLGRSLEPLGAAGSARAAGTLAPQP